MKSTKLTNWILAAVMVITAAMPVQAQSIWTNDITATDPSASNPFTTGDVKNANITVSGIRRGAGATANAGSNRYNASSWNTASLDTTAYFEWTLDANSGYEIDLTSFVYTGQASGSFTSPQFAFRSSLDSYSANIGTPATTGTTISLSGAAYQNLTEPVTFRLYVWGGPTASATYSVNDFTFNGTVSSVASAGNNTAIVASTSSVAFGRVMQGSSNPTNNVTLNKTGTDTTTYTTTAGGQATVSGAGTSFTAGSQSDQISVGIDRSSTGVKSGTVTVDNTAADSAGSGQGSADANEVINVSATVVADRVITATGVNLGKVLVGSTTASQNTGLSTTGDDNNNTRVTVNGTAASSGGVTVATGTGQLFNDAADTATRSVTGNFTTSGSKSGNVGLSVTGEGLTGESMNAVNVGYTADVYQAANLSANNSVTQGDGDVVTLGNANTSDGGQRAAAEIVSKTLNGDNAWAVSGFSSGTTINQNTSTSGTASFNTTGKLNGTYTGTMIVGLQHADQTIQGTAVNDLGNVSWNFSKTVSGISAASGNAQLGVGNSYAGFGLNHNAGRNTTAELLGGTAGSATLLEMEFSTAPSITAGNDASRVSDVLDLSGSDGDLFVLQLSYDEAEALSLLGTENGLILGWLSGGEWINAVAGNTGGSANFLGDTAYNAGLLSLGNYGIDTANNTVWAVLNHNSEFSVIAVPEPSTYLMLGLGLGALVLLRRKVKKA